MDIKQLIYQVKKGEAKAEKAMYDYCYQHCFKIALVYCDDKAEAISVFNHAILYIFDHLHQLDKSENLLRWSSYLVDLASMQVTQKLLEKGIVIYSE